MFLEKEHKTININHDIRNFYFTNCIPKISVEGYDENIGSSQLSDINILQLMSRRIHLGKVVAEAKLQRSDGNTQNYMTCSHHQIMKEITDEKREEIVLNRIFQKSTEYLKIFKQTHKNSPLSSKIITGIFKDFIIPLTKEVQVYYYFLEKSNVKKY